MTAQHAWLRAIKRYVAFVLLTNLAWEFLQLPLYTIWIASTPQQLAFAVAHCTLGDLLIATSALVLSLLAVGESKWPQRERRRVLVIATALGVLYAIFSEWLNLFVRQSWAYSSLMPVVPGLGTGLAPLLQCLLLPPAGLWIATRPMTVEPMT